VNGYVYGLDEAAFTAACEHVDSKIQLHEPNTELLQLYATRSVDHFVFTGFTWGWLDYGEETLLEADLDELQKDARFIFRTGVRQLPPEFAQANRMIPAIRVGGS
jgi:hypothetical protein